MSNVAAPSSPPTATTDPVAITRHGNLLFLDPPCESVLSPTLRFWERQFLRGLELTQWINAQKLAGKAPKKYKLLLRTLFTTTAQPAGRVLGVCPVGLLSRLCATLRAAGLNYRIRDAPGRPQTGMPDFSRLQPLRGNQPEVIAAVTAEEYGLVNAPTAHGKSFLMGELAAIWPNERIVIVCPKTEVINTLEGYLRERGLDPGVCRSGRNEIKRVTLCTPHALANKLRDLLDEIRILMFDEVYLAAGPVTAQALGLVRYARMYGFAAKPLSRGDGRNMLIESLFGSIVTSTEYQEAVDLKMIAPIHVLVFRVRKEAEPIRVSEDDTVNKRWCYWRNDVRNHAIAEAVDLGAAHLGMKPEDCQTLILVETAEHALLVKKHLPHFIICHSGGLSKTRKEYFLKRNAAEEDVTISANTLNAHRLAFEAGELKHVIATPVWSAGVNFVHLRMEIRGDARTSEIANTQFPGRLSRLSEGKEHGLLIDFIDEFSDWAEGRSEKRIAYYRRERWPLVVHAKTLPENL